ncbi:07f08402-0757-4d00-a5a1-61d68d1a4f54 [Sclerotinia trifoliorum]|uniref:07f08402-0757-4d00-a5a1-61d68d1a4f54 n=1 Tax=Sclerotinia trifoliorum TaxID=28548 RepID=A0A8H2VP23_9HELO|nr:07f08402-0757-4d00-a5a1-61d68d1a4f54 [Sclerotinia trifoliorum]
MLRTISNSLNPLFGSPKKSTDSDRFEGEKAHRINMSSPNDITLAEFNQTLTRYPALLNKYANDAREGVTPLQELDRYRYVEAPARFKDGSHTFTIEDVTKLVDWKLRHGAYRPGFLKKVGKNTNEAVEAATKDAFEHYKANPADIGTVISKLKDPLMGIGPATASLILSVHDPDHVTFFSDEVFKWLVNDGEHKPTPKYNLAEFEKVHAAAKTLAARLRVNPLQIEKVAFVIIKESEPVLVPKEKPAPSGRGRGRPTKPDSEKKVKAPSGRGRGRPPSGIVKPKPTPRVPKAPKEPKPAKVPKAAKEPKAAKVPKSPKAKAPAADAEKKTPGKRGRPAKAAPAEDTTAATPSSGKKRGRPAKDASAAPGSATPASKKRKASDDAATPASAGRGRPKKVKA